MGPLREYPHDGEASFIHGDALHQGVAGGAAALVRQLSELDDRHADDAVLAGKAVVLYWDMQLIGLWTMFITQNTGRDDESKKVKLQMSNMFSWCKIRNYLQFWNTTFEITCMDYKIYTVRNQFCQVSCNLKLFKFTTVLFYYCLALKICMSSNQLLSWTVVFSFVCTCKVSLQESGWLTFPQQKAALLFMWQQRDNFE